MTSRGMISLGGSGGGVRSAAFSPDGAVLAIGSDAGAVRVWAWTKDVDKPAADRSGHGGAVRSVAFGQDGSALASAGDDGTVRLWHAPDWAATRTLTGHGASLQTVTFSSDGAMLAAGGDDGTVQVWDMTSGGAPGARVAGHTGCVCSVAFSSDGAALAAGGDDGTVRIWDTHTSELQSELTGHTGTVRTIAFSSDGAMLAAGGDDGTAVAAVVAMLYTVWVPHEIVDFTPGPKGQPPAQEVGYVLSEGDGWITILTSGAHQIVRFNDSAAKSFEVCERGPGGGWSDVANAATLWQETTRASFLDALHAAANALCFPPRGK